MRQHERKLQELDTQVCVITFGAEPLAMSYVRETQLQWPLLVDTKRVLYKTFSMDRGTSWNIYGPASAWIYCKLLLRGRRLQLPDGDAHQLGGDVLIDPNGTVRLHHIGSGPADRPAISELLETISLSENGKSESP